MNSIEGALFTFLQTAPTVANYVGGAGATPPSVPRIYPTRVRQGAQYPALSYHVVAGDSEISLDGHQVGKGYKRIQISTWSPDITQAKTIVEAIRILLAGYVGLWDDVNVAVSGFNAATDLYDHTAKVYHIAAQLLVWHDEPQGF